MFNVGDKVRVIKRGQGHFGGYRFDQIGVVEDIKSEFRLIARFDQKCHDGLEQYSWHLLTSEVELVELAEGIKDNGMYY